MVSVFSPPSHVSSVFIKAEQSRLLDGKLRPEGSNKDGNEAVDSTSTQRCKTTLNVSHALHLLIVISLEDLNKTTAGLSLRPPVAQQVMCKQREATVR